MMKNVMGIINLQSGDGFSEKIADKRPVAALPFAGGYRLIDFALSNMVNSGIQSVGILLPNKSRSIMDHVRSGKDWDLARKDEGLCYLPSIKPINASRKGDVRGFYYNLDYVERSQRQYLLLSGGNVVCNMDFEPLLRFHKNSSADISMVYCTARNDCSGKATVLQVSKNSVVNDIALNSSIYKGDKVFMGICFMDRRVFLDVVNTCHAHGGTSLLKDGFMKLNGRYTMCGYEHKGYVACINSVESYYKANMYMLDPKRWQDLLMDSAGIYTKMKDEAPAKYKNNAVVTNSMIANGCVVDGTVENSVLFSGVTVAKGAVVRNCIIMQKCDLQENITLENVICDKNVIITKDKWLKGVANYPLVVEKGAVI